MTTGNSDKKIHCVRNYPLLIVVGGFVVLFSIVALATPIDENDKYALYLTIAIGYLILSVFYVRMDFYDNHLVLARPFILQEKRIAYGDISHITFEHIDLGRDTVFNPVKIHSLKIGSKPRKVYVDQPGRFYSIFGWLREKGVAVAGRDEQNVLTSNLDRIWDSYKWPKE